MKRITVSLLLILLLIMVLPLSVTAQENITVLIDGLSLKSDAEPMIYNNRTLVPFRSIAEAMGIEVQWDELTRRVYAAKGIDRVTLQIDNQTAYINEVPSPLEAAPQIANGRTLIPLRFFSEAFGCQVSWDDQLRQVHIITPTKDFDVIGFYALGDSQTSSWSDLFCSTYPETAVGHTSIISELALGWYSLDEKGNLLDKSRTGWQRPEGWEAVLDAARQYDLNCEMVVHVTDGDRTITHLLNDTAAMQRAVKTIGKEAQYYSGVNLDFEGLGYNDSGTQLEMVRQSFNRFADLLKKELGNKGLTLTLHAPNSAYPGYDYEELGKISDRIIIMAYDYGPRPEPLNMVKQAVESARRSVPAGKLILGISAPSETAASIPDKITMAKNNNLGGIALWRLGVINEGMWQALGDGLTPETPAGKL